MNSIDQSVYGALKASYELHESLGADGQTATETNQFGDTAMVADIRAEKVMMDALQADGIGGTVHSEEHGILKLPAKASPSRLIVMDGLDGSSVYKRARGNELYGTMLAVFEHEDPLYEEYMATGIAVHSLHLAVIASRKNGLSVIDLRTNQPIEVNRRDMESISDGRIFVDDGLPDENALLYPYFKTNFEVFGEPLRGASFTTEHTGSSAAYYALLALGKASLVGEATRKGNLEFASAYPIVSEAGGTMIDAMTGDSLGSQHFLDYGQVHHRPTLASANKRVEREARGLINTGITLSDQA